MEPAYEQKLKSLEYRHVNKKTYWNKKYYYTVAATYNPSKEELAKCVQAKKEMFEITMKSGSKYYGEVNDKNEREGYGRYEVINAGVYDGYWRRGFKHDRAHSRIGMGSCSTRASGSAGSLTVMEGYSTSGER